MAISAGRVTQFAQNGAMWRPYGSFAGKAEQVIEPEVTAAPGGKGKRRKYRGYPRKVVINGRVHIVTSAEEERALLDAWRATLEADALEAVIADGPQSAPARRLRVKVRQAERRLAEVGDRAQDWERFLMEEEEDLIVLLH